jgi:hypothetical protein
LAFSYWIDYLGFITEGRLAVVLSIPSLGVPNWSVIYIINTAPSSKFSDAIVREREDFCKGVLISHKYRESCVAFSISKSVEPNEELKVG